MYKAKKLFYFVLSLLMILNILYSNQRHPCLITAKNEGKQIKNYINKYELIENTYLKYKNIVEGAINSTIDVPTPGESGSYAHERHKQNYREMRKAGILFTITGKKKYAKFVKDMLDQYAMMYPKLGPHPLSHHHIPGKIFHQILNETVWLVNTSIAYDCVYEWLSKEDRKKYEQKIFIPMAEWFINHPDGFDYIHNHGMWAQAAVGMLGYVIDNLDYVEMALYGTKKNSTHGFFRQLDELFSPDGYYMEGPYYVRYAMRPLYLFSEAIHRNQPELGIYEYKDKLLKKSFYAALSTTFPNGVFSPINDASRNMDIQAPGLVFGSSCIYGNYNADKTLLGVAKVQEEVMLNGYGLALAKEYEKNKPVPSYTLESIELKDGNNGQKGGLGILRTGKGKDQTVLLMKYGVHGLGHGHFDKLHFIFFNQEQEIIPDYGFCRWINIETKFGGRYLDENDTYAKQTLAHNTVVVDKTSQNKANRKAADKVWAERHFFNADNKNIQVMSAVANDHYEDVNMQRTMFLIEDDNFQYPFVVDLYRLDSDNKHTYDYPIHFRGQFMDSNFDYKANIKEQTPLAQKYGYQHIWEEAYSNKMNKSPIISWLDGNRFYTYIGSSSEEVKTIFGRTGANDPNFNLRSESMFMLRSEGKDQLFAGVIEPHGYFNEAREISRTARPQITNIDIIGFNDKASVIEINGTKDIKFRIIVNNGEPDRIKVNSVEFKGQNYSWKGNFKFERIQ